VAEIAGDLRTPAYVHALRLLCAKEFPSDKILHLTEKFPAETHDDVWLPALAAERDWIIVSGDPRISRSPQEQAAWLSAGLTTFFLAKGWMDRPFWFQATMLIRLWPEIRAAASQHRGVMGFLVRAQGKIEVLPPVRARRPAR
jgi:hypothetical protein